LHLKIEELSRTINSLKSSGLDRSLPDLAASLQNLPEIKGTLGLEAKVSGNLERPEFGLNLEAEKSVLKKFHLACRQN